MKKNRMIVTCMLCAIILFYLINNYIWLSKDHTFLAYDALEHYFVSVALFDQLHVSILPDFRAWLMNPIIHHRWHGIFVPLCTAPAYFIFGFSQDSAIMLSAAFFLSLLIFGVYGLGKELKDAKTGLLAAFLVGLYPSFITQSRTYMYDLPLSAFVCLAMYHLLKLENSFKVKNIFILSVVLGFGMLIKINLLGFVFAPLVYVIWRVVRGNRSKFKKAHLLLFGILLIVPSLILFPFLKYKLRAVWLRFYECSWANPLFWGESIHVSYWFKTGLKFILWSIEQLMGQMMSPILFLLFVLGAFCLFFRKDIKKWLLFLWFVLPILILGFAFHLPLDNRYLMPLLPAAALVTSIGLLGIKNKILRYGLLAVVLFFGPFQYYAVSYESTFPLGDIRLPFLKYHSIDGTTRHIPIFHKNYPLTLRNQHSDFGFPIREMSVGQNVWDIIVADQRKDIRGDLLKYPSVFLCDYMPDISAALTSLSRLHSFPMHIMEQSLSEEAFFKERNNSFIDIYSLEQPDYIVAYEKIYVPAEEDLPESIVSEIRDKRNFYLFKANNYEKLKTVYLPDKKLLNIYKKSNRYMREKTGILEIVGNDGFLSIMEDGLRTCFLTMYFKYGNKNYLPAEAVWQTLNYADGVYKQRCKWNEVPFVLEFLFSMKNKQKIVFSVNVDAVSECNVDEIRFFSTISNSYGYVFEGDVLTISDFAFNNIEVKDEEGNIHFCKPVDTNQSLSISFDSGLFLVQPILSVNRNQNVFQFSLLDNSRKGVYLKKGKYNLFECVFSRN